MKIGGHRGDVSQFFFLNDAIGHSPGSASLWLQKRNTPDSPSVRGLAKKGIVKNGI